MTTAVAQYRPMYEIVLFSGASHYLDAKNYEAFKQHLKNEKFVEIDGELVNVSAIERVKKAKQELSLVESLLAGKNNDLKEKVRQVVRQREKEGLKVTEGVIINIIEKYEHA